ncbi:hypothetical protein KUTeg_000403 [Tegillarca granosa]|uniref:TLC domain-containing protein n=1 Tax=Tegillarca granosa TaxID=220873 RepID=A0ABQ9FYI4_TEGGR|nr:hypothetical protein KUTeg_000403 [Tegillarca granosa]
MGMRRPRSTKNPPIFSHEFFIQNHADIVSCIAMVFVIGLMFQATAPVATLFVAMQHNVTLNDTESNNGVQYYTCGLKDLFKNQQEDAFESFLNINQLWEGYPHANMSFILKFFFIIQIAYWIHCFPELYFQKVKKEEMSARIHYAVLYLVFIAVAFSLNFTRVALCMLVLHYTVEFVFHLARLLYFAEKTDLANTGFMVFNVINCLAAVCLLQAWMMWNFINFHLRRLREKTAVSRKLKSPAKRKTKVQEEDISSLPEVDQNSATENGSIQEALLQHTEASLDGWDRDTFVMNNLHVCISKA